MSTSARVATAMLTAMLAAAGCFTRHVLTPYTDAGDVQERRSFDTTPPFKYEKTEIPFTNHVVGAGASSLYELRILEMPSFGDNGQDGNLVTARYFRSRLPGSHPLVIVLPIWGSYTYPSRKICRYIQQHSDGAVNVLDIQGENYLVDWPELAAAPDAPAFLELWRKGAEHQRVTVIDVRRLIDWAEQRPEINGRRVALIGFSHGAIVAGAVVTQEPRLAAAVLVMGGAHTHSIIAHCTGERTSSIRQKAKLGFGWSPDELEAQLEPVFRDLDPATYPGRVDPTRVLIIEANRDTCVPEASREDLWLALGRPEKISLDYGHHRAFFSMTPLGLSWMRHRIWEFLKPRLLEQPPPTRSDTRCTKQVPPTGAGRRQMPKSPLPGYSLHDRPPGAGGDRGVRGAQRKRQEIRTAGPRALLPVGHRRGRPEHPPRRHEFGARKLLGRSLRRSGGCPGARTAGELAAGGPAGGTRAMAVAPPPLRTPTVAGVTGEIS